MSTFILYGMFHSRKGKMIRTRGEKDRIGGARRLSFEEEVYSCPGGRRCKNIRMLLKAQICRRLKKRKRDIGHDVPTDGIGGVERTLLKTRAPAHSQGPIHAT